MDKKKIIFITLGSLAVIGLGIFAYKQITKSKNDTKSKDSEEEKKEDDKKEDDKKVEDKKTDGEKPIETTNIKVPFSTKFQGNIYRAWVNKNYPDFKDTKGEKLDAQGKIDSSTFKEAWNQYGSKFLDDSLLFVRNIKTRIEQQGKERRNTILNYLEDTKKQPLDLSKSGSFTWNPNKKVVLKFNDDGTFVLTGGGKTIQGVYFSNNEKNQTAIVVEKVGSNEVPLIFTYSHANDDLYNGLKNIIKGFTDQTVSFNGYSADGGIMNAKKHYIDSQDAML
jgi:hypothetical protein